MVKKGFKTRDYFDMVVVPSSHKDGSTSLFVLGWGL